MWNKSRKHSADKLLAKNIPQFTPVEVVWQDARSAGGWFSYGDVQEWGDDYRQYMIHSYGYLIKADKNSVIIVMSKDEKENEGTTAVHALLEVPRPMVKAIYKIARGKKLA